MDDEMIITAFHEDTVHVFGCARRKACHVTCGEGVSSQSFSHMVKPTFGLKSRGSDKPVRLARLELFDVDAALAICES